MNKNRLEAFSDGVLAIIITIMVLEFKKPESDDLKSLLQLLPTFLSYALSFIYVGIYWNNHHHMFHSVKKITGKVLWKNLHLLFWLSLVPFVTGWIGDNHLSALPVALYGIILLLAAISYLILERELIKIEGPDSILANAIGNETKGKISGALYIAGIGGSFISPWIGIAMYALVAIIWFIPDKRIEKYTKQ